MNFIYTTLLTVMLSMSMTNPTYANNTIETAIQITEEPEASISDIEDTIVLSIQNRAESIQERLELKAEELTKPQNRWDISLSDDEKAILAQIVNLESGNQSDLGQQAVIEVVFNRVRSGNYANSVIDVLSEKGQFSTWKNRHRATPGAREYANIEAVLNGDTNILPYKTVKFSRKAQNSRIERVIEDHVFCNEK